MNPDLAYLLGALRDGSVYYYSKNRSYYTIFYQKNKTWLIRSIGRRLDSLYNVNYRIDEYKPGHYRLRVSSKQLYCLWRDVFSFPSEGLSQYHWLVPSVIFHSPPSTKSSFLRGFFDAEGDVSPPTSSTYYLGISQKNKSVLVSLRHLLRDFGIVSSSPILVDKLSQTYRIIVSNLSNICLFAKHIGCEHPDKSAKLDRILSSSNSGYC